MLTTPEHRTDLSSGTSLLFAKDLHKRFGGLSVLSGITVDVPSGGEVLAVIGPNGSGKTTLLNLLGGVFRADAGSITLDGVVIGALRPDERAALGLARTFQRPRTYPRLTALENVLIGAHLQGKFNMTRRGSVREILDRRRTLNEEARTMLDRVKVSADKEGVKAEYLSLSEQRAVELARALMMKPRILLLDEPTSGMDPAERLAWIGHIRGLQEELGLALIVVEHSMRVVHEIANQVIVLHAGSVLAQGKASDVLADEAVRNVYIGKRSTGA